LDPVLAKLACLCHQGLCRADCPVVLGFGAPEVLEPSIGVLREPKDGLAIWKRA